MFASAPNYHLECKIYPWDTYLMAITYRESIWNLGEFLISWGSSWYLKTIHAVIIRSFKGMNACISSLTII